MIKPELGFYKHVLDSIDLQDPTTAIFVDDKLVNVIAARSFGIHGIVCKSSAQVIRQLRNELLDPIPRARSYMRNNARNHVSQIENGAELRDVFSQFLIHHVLHDGSIINLSTPDTSEAEVAEKIAKAGREAQTWNYFIGQPQGTTSTFPDDVDDTAIALLAFSPPASSANKVLDKLLTIRHARDGLVQTYFDEQRPRVCPWVLVNVVRGFYHYRRGADVQKELQYVSRVLLSRAYVDGSDYYASAEPFLYFLSCLVHANPDAAEVQALRVPLANACRERVGRRDDAFAVAARVLACQALGVWAESDVTYLKDLQQSDGGWEHGWVCSYGRSKKRIGNRGVVTAFAIKALEQDARNG
jgi:hypothetical protein